MNGNDLIRLGFESGKALSLALKAVKSAQVDGLANKVIRARLVEMLDSPAAFASDPLFSEVAAQLLADRQPASPLLREPPAPYRVWGAPMIESGAIAQMERAVRLPVAVRGALMPDAHQGYGLPIGGVLATQNSVIPYAVGMDIACRMRLSIFDQPFYALEQKRDRFRRALIDNTVFGSGRGWDTPAQHTVMDDPAWRDLRILRDLKQVAWAQLGTSGSGNHFVEFGKLDVREAFTITTDGDESIIPAGSYLALLSHSGSRRLGAEVARHYTDLAMQQHPDLPKDYVHLAWLDLQGTAGAEYWLAMNLAGRYASANHAVIHEKITALLRLPLLGVIENHHNFAWQEIADGESVIVHRKGATPAGAGVLGIIPGSMNAPGYLVRGRGVADSLASASHGAGRRMSRSEASKRFEWSTVKRVLKDSGVELLSAGLDEAPGAYKDIRQVMADQQDLVEVLGEFQPRLVRMDDSDGPAED